MNGAAENHVSQDLAYWQYDRDKNSLVISPVNGDGEAANRRFADAGETSPFNVAF